MARNLFPEGLRRRRPGTDLSPNLAGPAPGPEPQASARSTLQQVRARLADLPEPDRSALLMHAWDGLPYNDISRILGVSLASAKVKFHRARRRLSESVHQKEKMGEMGCTTHCHGTSSWTCCRFIGPDSCVPRAANSGKQPSKKTPNWNPRRVRRCLRRCFRMRRENPETRWNAK